MRLPRRALLAVLVVLCLAAPSWALTVAGKVVDHNGRPVAGALVSDGERIVRTGKDGAYSLASRPELVVALTAPPKMRPAGRWWWPAGRAAKLGTLRLKEAPPSSNQRYPLSVISDPHLYVAALEPSWAAKKVDSRLPMLTWQRVMARVRDFGPALTLVAGDLAMEADKGDPARGKAYMEMAAEAVNLMPGAWRATPGNHDVRYDGGKVSLAQWRRHLGPARSVYLLGPAAIILLDNVGLTKSRDGKASDCGLTSRAGLVWLRSLLALLPRKTPLVLVSHYPLLSPLAGVNPLYPRALVAGQKPGSLALRDVDQNTALIMRLLQGRPVAALISGHQHAWFNNVLISAAGPLQQIGAPAVCGRWWQGDMRYGPLKFKPGYLEGWLVKRGGNWQVRLSMVQITLASKP
ncbi:MAG: metallophosphoesterase [Desulfarculaceae bacterium]|nr:metallophosphoesterase [Desulfarculaceae bacterium]MCF8072740.1 metallophosphoesterase [Desulfarculaceae bacterium]MCF8103026.1 metallophosphoesterase [Desulfarculaceae bacterium]MCF8118109.1 metallophosphoesterase [Desulfarculaceae bacterium]